MLNSAPTNAANIPESLASPTKDPEAPEECHGGNSDFPHPCDI